MYRNTKFIFEALKNSYSVQGKYLVIKYRMCYKWKHAHKDDKLIADLQFLLMHPWCKIQRLLLVS